MIKTLSWNYNRLKPPLVSTTQPCYIVYRKKLAVKIETTEDDDSSTGQLRLPKSSSIAAMPQQPVMKPKPQPESAVFAYSIGRGRGAPVQDNAMNGKHSALLIMA